jgi:hypothetical protein
LLDDLAAKIRIDQTAHCSVDGSHKAGIRYAILPCEFRKSSGLENTHK